MKLRNRTVRQRQQGLTVHGHLDQGDLKHFNGHTAGSKHGHVATKGSHVVRGKASKTLTAGHGDG